MQMFSRRNTMKICLFLAHTADELMLLQALSHYIET